MSGMQAWVVISDNYDSDSDDDVMMLMRRRICQMVQGR